MQKDIRIGVARQTKLTRDRDAAKNERAARFSSMRVPTVTNAEGSRSFGHKVDTKLTRD